MPALVPALFKPPEERHDSLWISDGNIVMSAVNEEETCTILFCVHRSSLTRQSEVFESMFNIPQGEDSRFIEVYEGLPLVRLPDSAKEVEGLLNVMHDPLYVI